MLKLRWLYLFDVWWIKVEENGEQKGEFYTRMRMTSLGGTFMVWYDGERVTLSFSLGQFSKK